ncbi:hypothetical protein RKD55_002865 [Rossellomorea marisflavi]
MNHLGILTLNPDPANPFYSGIGKESLSYPIHLHLFSPEDLSPFSEGIEGYTYCRESGIWKEDAFRIPEYLYDRTYYQAGRQQQAKAVVQWLKQQPHVTFLGYGLPNKWVLYEELQKGPLAPYLPGTRLLREVEDLTAFLNREEEAIIKPVDGAHGFGIYHLRTNGPSIIVRTTKKDGILSHTFHNRDEFKRFTLRLMKKHTFLIQRRLENQVQDRPYDLRVHMAKDPNGNWQEHHRAFRYGNPDGILTNVSSGAMYIPYDEWKAAHPGAPWEVMEEELKEILTILPMELEDRFSPLLELGIDITIGADHSIWLLDINSKPGHKLMQNGGVDSSAICRIPLDHCMNLSSQSASTRSDH